MGLKFHTMVLYRSEDNSKVYVLILDGNYVADNGRVGYLKHSHCLRALFCIGITWRLSYRAGRIGARWSRTQGVCVSGKTLFQVGVSAGGPETMRV